MSALEKQDVLVIDDDDSIRNMLRVAFRHAGLSCEIAVDGLDALEKLGRSEFTIILLDLMMPRLDGYQFMSRLREIQKRDGSRPVVLIMTAARDANELPHTGDVAQAIVGKPFDLPELAEIVSACVEEHRKLESLQD